MAFPKRVIIANLAGSAVQSLVAMNQAAIADPKPANSANIQRRWVPVSKIARV
jgi:hypothetical protein